MARFNYEVTEAKIEKWIAEGRGKGKGYNYKPWLTVMDIPSRGQNNRDPGIKSKGRSYQVFSVGEDDCAYIFDLSPRVIDIREQYPLLPPEETQEIAKKLVVSHPNYKGKDIVMTTDFNLTVLIDGTPKSIYRTLKQSADLLDPRTLLKLEIERIYYQSRNEDWGIIVRETIPKDLALNCRFFYEYFYVEKIQIEQSDLDDIFDKLTPLVLQKKTELRYLTKECDRLFGLNKGDSLKAAQHFIARRKWIVDLNKRYDQGKILDILGVNGQSKPE